MFQPTLGPFPLAFSIAGFLFGGVMAGSALLLHRPSASKSDPRHTPEAWARAGVFGFVWTRPADGSANAVLVLMILLAGGLAGSALPRLANSLFDRSSGVLHLQEIVEVEANVSRKSRPALPGWHVAFVTSPHMPYLPLRIAIPSSSGDAVGKCIGIRVHPGLLKVAWYEVETAPRACPNQGSNREESP